MNEQRKNELNMLLTTATEERDSLLAQGRASGQTQRDFEATLAGMSKQIESFQRQLNELRVAEQKAGRAKAEAEAIAEKQRLQAEKEAEERRRKAAEQARIDAEKKAAQQAAADKARAERLAAEARARQEAADAERRRKVAEAEASKREKQRAQERAALLGAVLTGPNGEEATKFRLKVPGGHVVVQFVPEVTE